LFFYFLFSQNYVFLIANIKNTKHDFFIAHQSTLTL
jgi:hypothetical protein